ncbi:Dabb family protein [Clostridium fallax]|uniref:Stress responsive A/B Barrel Domain n=1 Tax=Clostridium fallax TaxID=1533 RepID=A0A1M4VLE9_9CLOT|nr:Dabb family protein [Clostridium fallax]SHE69653.1 Stress responsive A/B Barrel Domain [Clostridium fallax]SQB22775.1 stress responsive alpha-beta barrel domain-containing protein [Clostridium fallax]
MFTHIVFFKLSNPTKDNLNKAEDILKSMEGKIPELKGLEVGIDVLKTERSFDIALVTRFISREDYETYTVSDFHVNNVLKNLKPMLECSKTVDYFL